MFYLVVNWSFYFCTYCQTQGTDRPVLALTSAGKSRAITLQNKPKGSRIVGEVIQFNINSYLDAQQRPGPNPKVPV